MRVYKCKTCGNVVMVLENGGGELSCCKEAMERIQPSLKDGSNESHLPIFKDGLTGFKVSVGKILHPMTSNHSIMWMAIETDKSILIHHFKSNEKPIYTFKVPSNEVVMKVYAYCNIHGLWERRVYID